MNSQALTLEEMKQVASDLGRYYQSLKVNFRGGRKRTREHTGERTCKCVDCRKAKVGGPRGIAAADPLVAAAVRAKALIGTKRRAAANRNLPFPEPPLFDAGADELLRKAEESLAESRQILEKWRRQK